MKTLFLAVICILSHSALALPIPPQFVGHFKFDGKLNTINTLKKEVVNTSYTPGKQRLAELKKLGFTCATSLSNTYSCAKNTNDSIPQDIEQKLSQKMQQNPLEFGSPLGDWELISTAEHLIEFVIQQKTQIGDKLYTQSRYLITPTIQKLVLKTDKDDSLWFNVYDGKLQMVLTAQKTLGRNKYEIYLVEAGFDSE